MEQWKKNLYILWGAVFLLMAAMTSIMPFLPLHIEQNMGIESDKDISLWAGFIFGANFFSAFLFSPIWGRIADRYGRKIMILRSGFGMAIVVSLMGLANNVYQLFFLRLLNGVIAGFNPSAIALVATGTPKDKVGYALGTLQSGAVAGTIIGPTLGGFVADYIGFKRIFVYTGILILIAAFIVLFFVKEDFDKKEAKEHKSSFKNDFQTIIKTQPLLALFSVSFLITFAAQNVLPILPLFIKELGPPGGRISFFAGIVAGVMGFANMLASPKLGKLGDKYGSEKVLFYSLLGAAIFFLPQGFAGNVWQLMFWRFLLGITLGGLLPSVNSLVRLFAPKGLESTTYGYSNSAIFLGGMLGPITGGILAGFIGFQGVFLFTAIILFIDSIWVKRMINKKIQNVKGESTII